MVGLRQATAFHYDRDEHGQPLTAEQRERLIRPYLPEAEDSVPQESVSASPDSRQDSKVPSRKQRPKPVRHFVKSALHLLLYNLIQFIFSIYVRFRIAYHNVSKQIGSVLYYHHRSPEYIQRDVQNLSKIPRHLSIILELDENEKSPAGLEALVNDVCEVVAWSACAGVPMLSIYEKTGILKSSIPHLHRRISRTLSAYYGSSNPLKPTVSLGAPHMQSFSPPSSPPTNSTGSKSPPHLSILLLSASDGRRTLVDLTKTLAEMSQKAKIFPEDISAELIDAELTESVMGEPDLLILFGDSVVLQGYPPWQVRLTEIYYVQDNNGVGYQVFLRGLRKYAGAQMRFGS
ncbi:hypothetical protein AAFC00_007167 [Neodothiora populina]|uniref:ditrans,polycis-polyprenyl diphosphate synthase [(2E,6E)-farnesyldiphosphate specific] n=1 Tax=Neodothiora populina TaxID=2781224 RepID=A0ABR3PHE4_9PEZI